MNFLAHWTWRSVLVQANRQQKLPSPETRPSASRNRLQQSLGLSQLSEQHKSHDSIHQRAPGTPKHLLALFENVES